MPPACIPRSAPSGLEFAYPQEISDTGSCSIRVVPFASLRRDGHSFQMYNQEFILKTWAKAQTRVVSQLRIATASDAGAGAVRPAPLAQLDSDARFYEELDMKTDLNHSHQVRAQTRQHSGFTPSGAAPL